MQLKDQELVYQSCPICSSGIGKWRTKFNRNKEYNIDICQACGYAFVNPRPSFDFLMNYYRTSGHEPGGIENATNAITLNSILSSESRDPNSTVDAKRMFRSVKSLYKKEGDLNFLDVGCGYGFFSKEALENGFRVYALELAELERNIAKQMTGVDAVASSFEDFTADPNYFSVILMSQILEHVLDVNEWIEKAHNLLQSRGILIIALPNFGSIFRKILQENEPFITPPTHLNFFNNKSLTLLLEKHGFRVVESQWISRISNNSIERRLPSFGKPLLPLINRTSQAALNAIDSFNLGMILNVYAQKI